MECENSKDKIDFLSFEILTFGYNIDRQYANIFRKRGTNFINLHLKIQI